MDKNKKNKKRIIMDFFFIKIVTMPFNEHFVSLFY